ncbi:MAG: ABC transporter ATP-binding protein [Candidatus Dormibacteraeota bacterium]|nr:ABC transporter ATP-binding protein [Candidatus Dormibacteraeota bacterium]
MTLLEVRSVSKRFGGVLALGDVSFDVEEGGMVGVIGPNGAGKTTLFDIIAGLQRPTSGAVELNGRVITRLPAYRIAHLGLARTFQIPRLFGQVSVRENALVGALSGARRRGEAEEHADSCLERVGLADRAQARAEQLNLADRRRLEIARVLALEPKVVLLDEAMSGLSELETNRMMELVRALNRDGTTFVLVEHVMKIVMGLCARIVVLDHGSVITAGTPGEVVRDERVIRAYLGSEADVPA